MKNAIQILILFIIITVIGITSAQSAIKVNVTWVNNTYSVHLTSDVAVSSTLSAFQLGVRFPNTCTISTDITFAGYTFIDLLSYDPYAGSAPGHAGYKIWEYQYSQGSTALTIPAGGDIVIGTFTITGGTTGIVDLVHESGGAGMAVVYVETGGTTDLTSYPDPLSPNNATVLECAATTVTETPNANTWYYLRYNPAPLPVELTSLTATANRMNAQISWSTATEVNNFGFEVERRSTEVDNSSWIKVGFVAGNGTSNIQHTYSYADASVAAGMYAYRIKQIDNDGAFKYSQTTEVEIGIAPKELTLSDNYPNPFNPSTNIEFTVAATGKAVLKIYNALGQEVAELFNGEAQAGKIMQARFDASRFASGVFYSRLQADGKSLVKRMMLIK